MKIKKISFYSLIFFTLLTAAKLPAEEVTTLFKQANAAYKEADYKEAEKLYSEILNRGKINGGLCYNLGNTYFKLNQKGLAILYYEKAKRYIPRDYDLKSNLAFLNSVIEDKVEFKRASHLERKLKRVYNNFSLSEFTLFTSFIYLMLIFAVLLSFFSKLVKLYLKWIALALGCVLVISSIFLVSKIYEQKFNKEVVVTTAAAKVYYAPAKEEVPAFIIHEGLKLTVKKEQDGWCLVRIGADKGGWIEKILVKGI